MLLDEAEVVFVDEWCTCSGTEHTDDERYEHQPCGTGAIALRYMSVCWMY
jgi:hypothetical protein